MRILRNYILKDFLSSFIFSLLALTLVMVLGNLVKVSDMVIRKGVDLVDALKILSIFVPYLLGFTIPLSLLMAVLLAMGRLISDNELIAINVAGISLLRILLFFLIIGFILSLFLYILNDTILPEFHYKYRWHMKNIYSKNITALIEPGVYLENFKDTVLYVDDVKENKLRGISIWETKEGGLVRVTHAKRGEFVVDNGILKIKLEEGSQENLGPQGKREFIRLGFKVNFIDLPVEEKQTVTVEKKDSDMTIKELREKVNALQKRNIYPAELLAHLYKRISISFSPLTFIILGFGVSLVVRHRERSINFGIAVVIAGAYYLLMLLGETLTNFELAPPLFSMWLPNIIVVGIGCHLIVKRIYLR